MFESMDKTGHNHALPETDRESYLQLPQQASTSLISEPAERRDVAAGRR